MADDDVVDVILAEDEGQMAQYAAAAGFLEKAGQMGRSDPAVFYLLAMARKRQGKIAEARAALRRIPHPDANVWLQFGLLSLREKQLAQAEGEFAHALQLDPASYPACYNLLLTRLSLGNLDACRALVSQVFSLAPSSREQRSLVLLQAVMSHAPQDNGEARPFDPILAEMSPQKEKELLQLLRGLGQLDVSHALLKVLAEALAGQPGHPGKLCGGRSGQGQDFGGSRLLVGGPVLAQAVARFAGPDPRPPDPPVQSPGLYRLLEPGLRGWG